MRLIFSLARKLSAAVIALAVGLPLGAEGQSLSHDWLFYRGDLAGASLPTCDDHAWLKVEVPHDWSIADRPDGSSPSRTRARSSAKV